jgi:hypothetical protein
MRAIQRVVVSWFVSAAYLVAPAAWPDELQVPTPGLALLAIDVPTPELEFLATEGRDATQSDVEPALQSANMELGSAIAVSDESLAAARGGADLHVSQNNLDATLEGNVASNLTTGHNTITESAFSNSSGIPMVIQNSGNNVIIQNSTILNLQLN